MNSPLSRRGSDRADELGLGAEVAEALVPDAEVEVVGEARDEAGLGVLGDEAPARLGAADGGVEQRLGPSVEGVDEAVAAVERDRQRAHRERGHRGPSAIRSSEG